LIAQIDISRKINGFLRNYTRKKMADLDYQMIILISLVFVIWFIIKGDDNI
jgi:hypothetical protein